MEMVRTFKITRSTLDRALKYTINSSHADMLRTAAIQRGGRVYTGQIAEPEAEAVIEIFRATCPKRLDGSCFLHDACDMSCRHGRAFQSRLIIKKTNNTRRALKRAVRSWSRQSGNLQSGNLQSGNLQSGNLQSGNLQSGSRQAGRV